jgi:hypothetical protein
LAEEERREYGSGSLLKIVVLLDSEAAAWGFAASSTGERQSPRLLRIALTQTEQAGPAAALEKSYISDALQSPLPPSGRQFDGNWHRCGPAPARAQLSVIAERAVDVPVAHAR